MFTFCEPSGPLCAWVDDRMRTEAQIRDRFDVFVSDDIASYPSSFPTDAAPAVEVARHPGEPVQSDCRQPANVEPLPSTCRQPANEPAGMATVAVAAAHPTNVPPSRLLSSPTRRAHQSNSGSQRQMGGVRQTNRFFARRQFA